MRLLIMGPPGAGKGTQASSIAGHYRIPAISSGAMFRNAVASGSELGKQVGAIIARGGYVPDDLTDRVVFERLSQPDAFNGWLLDGFPRTLFQVEALDRQLAASGHRLDAVISLTADVDLLVARMLKRAEIEGRPDDTEEVIRKRMQVYARETEPLLDVYRFRGLLVEVDGMGGVDEVGERIRTALDRKVSFAG